MQSSEMSEQQQPNFVKCNLVRSESGEPTEDNGMISFLGEDGSFYKVSRDDVNLNSKEPVIWPVVNNDGGMTFLQLHVQTSQETTVSCDDNSAQPNATEADGEGSWTHSAVVMLIETFREHKNLFNNPKTKKKSIWEKISVAMREKGYNLTAEACDRKWRNLRQWYRFYVNKKRQAGKSKKVWRYYELMNEIYGQDVFTIPVSQTKRITDSSVPCPTSTSKATCSKSETQKFGQNVTRSLLSQVGSTTSNCGQSTVITTKVTSTSSNGSPKILIVKGGVQDDECAATVGQSMPPPKSTKKRNLIRTDEAPAWFTQRVQELRHDNEVLVNCIENSIEKLVASQNRRTELLQELLTHLKNS